MSHNIAHSEFQTVLILGKRPLETFVYIYCFILKSKSVPDLKYKADLVFIDQLIGFWFELDD